MLYLGEYKHLFEMGGAYILCYRKPLAAQQLETFCKKLTDKKQTAMLFKKLLPLLFLVTVLTCNCTSIEQNSANAEQNNIPYTILKQNEDIYPKFGRSVYIAEIRIENKLTEEELKSFCYNLKSEIKTNATDIRYFFYLPDMVVGNGAWATAVFNPDLGVTIFGSSKTEEQDIKNYVGNSSANYLGHWTDYSDLSHIIYGIKKENGKFILDGYSTNDNSYGTMAELTLSKKGNETIYLSDRPEEYYIINSKGDLDAYDAQGYIVTYQKIK